MPDFLHRTDKTLLTSVSYASLPEPLANYIEEPDLSAVEGWPSKYWIITGDTVSLADQSTRDAIDLAESEASKDATADRVDTVESYERAFAEVVLDEINVLRQQHSLADRTLSQLKTALRGKL